MNGAVTVMGPDASLSRGGSALGASVSAVAEGAVVGAALGSSDGELGSSGRLVGSTIDDGVGDDSGVGGAGGSGTDSVGVGVDVGVGVGVEGCVGGVGGRSFTRLVIVKPRT